MRLISPEKQQEITDRINSRCNPVYIAISGSIAHGTERENSDLDIRGIYMRSEKELLGLHQDNETKNFTYEDTVMHSLRKTVNLLLNCNPSIVEMFGIRKEHVIYRDDMIFPKLKGNLMLFLSKEKILASFLGYIHSLNKNLLTWEQKNMTEEKLSKLMMHAARLYLMGTELLEIGQVVTYREKDHDLLMSLRNGDLIDKETRTIKYKYWDMTSTLESNFIRAYDHSLIQKKADRELAENLLINMSKEYYFAQLHAYLSAPLDD